MILQKYVYPLMVYGYYYLKKKKNIVTNHIDGLIKRYIGKKRHGIKNNQFIIGKNIINIWWYRI